jgi:hypothetical protein
VSLGHVTGMFRQNEIGLKCPLLGGYDYIYIPVVISVVP